MNKMDNMPIGTMPIGTHKSNLVQLEIYNKRYDKYIKEIGSYNQYYNNNISLLKNNIESNLVKHIDNIKQVNDKFSFLSNNDINNILKNLKVGIDNNIDNIYNLDNLDNQWFNYKELFEYLIKKYDTIVFKNMNKLLDNNSKYRNIILILFTLFDFKGNISSVKLNLIKSLIYILDIKNSNLDLTRKIYNNKDLDYEIKFIYDEIDKIKSVKSIKSIENLDSFINYNKEFQKSNDILLQEKRELEELLNEYIKNIENLDFFNFNISLQDIIHDKKKYIDFFSMKEEYIKKNILDYKYFNSLFQNYINLKDILKNKDKNIKNIEKDLIKLDNYLKNNSEKKLKNILVIKQKKLRINYLNRNIFKISKINNKDDVFEYENNFEFLGKQNIKLNQYLIEIDNIEKKIIKLNSEIDDYNLLSNNSNNIIIKNKLTNKIKTSKEELENLEQQISSYNYDLMFIKKNIEMAKKNHIKYNVKKVISENLVNKINKNIEENNLNLKNIKNNSYFNKELILKEYENSLNELVNNKKLYSKLIKNLDEQVNEINSLSKKYNEIKDILFGSKYSEYFIIKNNITKVVDCLINIETNYKKYELVSEKINDKNSFIFIKKYFIDFENKYVNNVKSIPKGNNNGYRIIIDLYNQIFNFYNKNIYYIYHIFRFNTIINLDIDSLSFISLYNDIYIENKRNYDYYNKYFSNLIQENNELIIKYETVETNIFITKISKDIKNLNKFNKIKNNLYKLKNKLMKSDLNKIGKYLINI